MKTTEKNTYRERAVSTLILTVSDLNGFFNIWEREEGIGQAKVIHKTATSERQIAMLTTLLSVL